MKKNPIAHIDADFVKTYRKFMSPVIADLKRAMATVKPNQLLKAVDKVFRKHDVRGRFRDAVLSSMLQAFKTK